MKNHILLAIFASSFVFGNITLSSNSSSVNNTREEYVLIGWNDLGMHCANQDFSNIAVLPPFNNVRAQLIEKIPGEMPQIRTTGFRIEYSIPGNTYSVGKTNFWQYAQDLFGLPEPLPDNIGLTGLGLAGEMALHDQYFEAVGIPNTPYTDDDLVNEQPYQLIHLEAIDESTGALLATTDVTIPVSNEIGCVQAGCHSSETQILYEHEDEDGYDPTATPILCASCHASNALGTTGDPEARSMSYRIHKKHREEGPLYNINTCYKCHPGPDTQCFRGVMESGVDELMICQDCHGTMNTMYQSIDQGREPWLDEPSCGDGNCHGANYAEEPNALFRESQGHGGMFCSACHGSPHAVYPTRVDNDNLQSISLQGHAGTLSDCAVCHTSWPGGGGPHGYSGEPFETMGDANLDGEVNVLDIVVIIGFILGQDAPDDIEFAVSDLNGDGNLDVLDIVLMVQLIIGDQL